MVYDDLRELASRQLRVHGGPATINTTALVHEAYLRLAGSASQELEGRAHFLALAARAMRQLIIDYTRGQQAQKRGGLLARVTWREQSVPAEDRTLDVLVLNDAVERLGQRDPRLERVVECRFFVWMSGADTASALGVSERTIERDWQRARTYLHELLQDSA